MTTSLRAFLVAEVAFCFALPAYFLLWGILSLPLWLAMAGSGASFAVVHALCVVGGCLGLWALAKTLRYCLFSERIREPNWLVALPLVSAGLVSIWTEMTGQFAGFELNWFSAVSIVAPTLCAAHVIYLAIRASKTRSKKSVVPTA